MAITGTGTQADPFLVHSYDELKSTITLAPPSSTQNYVKLANDIDCNEYGSSWEWETITLFNFTWYIDLDGHTIKNMMIKSGNSLFSGKGSNQIIYNGKILNVFNNAGASVINGNGLMLKDISMSVNGTGLTSYGFNLAVFENCTVYFKSNKLNNPVFYCRTYPYCKNSDFYLDVNDKNSKGIFTNYSADGNSKQFLDNCRVRGSVGGASDAYYLLNGSCLNSVIEVDTTNMTWNNWGDDYKIPCDTNSTGIINTEISPNLIGGTSGLTACTTAQMRDADYLNSIGFTVVKVGE